jgi:ABC-type transporter MlaC component
MMTKRILFLALVVLFVSSGLVQAYGADPKSTVVSYLDALKRGDVEVIKDCIGGEFNSKHHYLLSHNHEYSQTLMSLYQNSSYRVKEDWSRKSKAVYRVDLSFENGSVASYQLLLKRDADGRWRIHEEIPGP